jgi:hypothetical protein
MYSGFPARLRLRGFDNLGRESLHLKRPMTIFDEEYRVIAVEHRSLTVRGVCSGNVLVIKADPDSPLNEREYPLGKLILLSDPSNATSI